MSEENKNNLDGEAADNVADLDVTETADGAAEHTADESADDGASCESDGKTDTAAPDVGSALFGADSAPSAKKPPRRIALTTFICSAVALVLAAVMVTYTLCSSAYQKKLADAKLENSVVYKSGYSELDVLSKIFDMYSFEELDDNALRTAVLKAYVSATGDTYAEYYTDEEYAALTAEMAGEAQGIGINIINSAVDIGGTEYKALKVINVVKDSPAEDAGLKLGDYVIAVGDLEENTTLNALGYDMGLKQLQGEKGTYAEFIVYRPDGSTTLPFKIMRDEFTTTSVMYKKADDGVSANTGVVKIISFDLTTPSQLSAAIDALKAQGCDKFVFDVRYNPGGELSSIVATLSYFLNEGDTVISVKDKAGNEEVTRVGVVAEGEASCTVSAEDIGKYADLDMVVLCNESTASAAELFVANFRDHKLGKVIGTTTYGKGSMQSYMSLAYFGINGVLKLTTRMYFPPCGESYEGEGIAPDVEIAVSESAASKNIYDIMGTSEDGQLVEAVKHFKK